MPLFHPALERWFSTALGSPTAAQRAGWECWYVPQSRVMHIRGQSTGVTALDQKPRRLPKYWFESRRR